MTQNSLVCQHFPWGKGMPEFCQVQMNQLQVEILDPQMVVPAEAIAFCLGQAAFDLG